MEQVAIKEILENERCGLFILAGLDHAASDTCGTLTIHAASGALRGDNIDFIKSRLLELSPDVEVRIRIYSSADLHTPDSLEDFARLFAHDTILADPTGAFSRVSSLLDLSRVIRSELGERVKAILWQPHASTLVVVEKQPATSDTLGEFAKLPLLEDAVISMVDRIGCPDLKKTIRSVSSSTKPSNRYTPVDSASRPVRPVHPPRTAMNRIMAWASGVAAFIGLGTLTAAQASLPPVNMDDEALMPGIIALVDLTTLGETSYGVRNPYQAIGGLRLYFGASGLLQASAVQPGSISDAIFRAREETVQEQEPDTPSEEGHGVLWQLPKHIIYSL